MQLRLAEHAELCHVVPHLFLALPWDGLGWRLIDTSSRGERNVAVRELASE